LLTDADQKGVFPERLFEWEWDILFGVAELLARLPSARQLLGSNLGLASWGESLLINSYKNN
jgi:hypothetical protein